MHFYKYEVRTSRDVRTCPQIPNEIFSFSYVSSNLQQQSSEPCFCVKNVISLTCAAPWWRKFVLTLSSWKWTRFCVLLCLQYEDMSSFCILQTDRSPTFFLKRPDLLSKEKLIFQPWKAAVGETIYYLLFPWVVGLILVFVIFTCCEALVIEWQELLFFVVFLLLLLVILTCHLSSKLSKLVQIIFKLFQNWHQDQVMDSVRPFFKTFYYTDNDKKMSENGFSGSSRRLIKECQKQKLLSIFKTGGTGHI